jgi:hypothetical protein
MKYRDVADYGPAGERGVSGREADDRYAPLDVFAQIGASLSLVADVVDASDDWDRVAVVRYATRRSFVEMQTRKDFLDRHVHKEAGMDHTIVMGTLALHGLPATAGSRRLLLEVWGDGAEPAPGRFNAVTFGVEGTIVGDGRGWSGARYTVLDEDDKADLSVATDTHQVLLLDPAIERWE